MAGLPKLKVSCAVTTHILSTISSEINNAKHNSAYVHFYHIESTVSHAQLYAICDKVKLEEQVVNTTYEMC